MVRIVAVDGIGSLWIVVIDHRLVEPVMGIVTGVEVFDWF